MGDRGTRASATLLVVAVALLVVVGCVGSGSDGVANTKASSSPDANQMKLVNFVVRVGMPGVNKVANTCAACLADDIKFASSHNMKDWNAGTAHQRHAVDIFDGLKAKWNKFVNKIRYGDAKMQRLANHFVAALTATGKELDVLYHMQNAGPYAASIPNDRQKGMTVIKARVRLQKRVMHDVKALIAQAQ